MPFFRLLPVQKRIKETKALLAVHGRMARFALEREAKQMALQREEGKEEMDTQATMAVLRIHYGMSDAPTTERYRQLLLEV